MQHAFIMNPLSHVKAWKDTTYYLMLACQQRGHRVAYLDQQSLWLDHDRLMASVQWVSVNEDHENPFTIEAEQAVAMAEMDAVWLRTDPPFDRRYFYTTLMLDYLPSSTRVLNQPEGVRNWNEKLAALVYPEHTPRTIVSNKSEEIVRFANEIGRITVKPIDGFGGKGIIFFEPGDDTGVLSTSTHDGSHWVIAQQFLPAASEGDKRILLLNGEPLGAILRLAADGQALNNLDQGGSAHQAKLDADDLMICKAMKSGLIEQGVFFAGIDIIGGKLIEVNVTSPTGLQELCRFNQQDYHHQIVTALES